MMKRLWRYTDKGVECLECHEEAIYDGINPFDLFDKIKHKDNCQSAHVKGGMQE